MSGRRLRDLLRNLAPQDWLVLGYFTALSSALFAARGPGIAHHAMALGSILVSVAVVIVFTRTRLQTQGLWVPLIYRLSLQGSVQFSYFLLATYLPLVNPSNLDAKLFALDMKLFGFEASLWFDSRITATATEWFAFFYYCYFFLLLVHSVPIFLFTKDQRLVSEFGIGLLTLYCVGQLAYALVPGFGPVRELASQFKGHYPHGLWLDSVMLTVASGGAQKDIFPSLHTAAPTFLTLFSMRNRRALPFGYTWPIVGFFAANIVIATMFLRWHWVIDVLAGLLLAWLGWWLGVVLTRRELDRRRDAQMPSSWPAIGFTRASQREQRRATTTCSAN